MVLVQKQTCDQWNKIKSPHICTHNFSHLRFDEDAKNILRRKKKRFQSLVLEKLDVHMQKNEIRPASITLHKT